MNGPFVVLEGVQGASFDEVVEITVDNGGLPERKLGRVVEINEDKAVVQVFEKTENLSLQNTHTRFTGHPMEIGLSESLLGRTFNGIDPHGNNPLCRICGILRPEKPGSDTGR